MREPESFSPSILSPGTVRLPNRTFMTAMCAGGGNSTVVYGICLSCSARSTVAQGCEPLTT